MVGPGDEIAGAEGHSPLRASRTDCEQVIDALKAAFVQGRLAKDEFDLRVGHVLAAYADLDALTADIPAGRAAAKPSEPARESHNKELIARGAAVGAGATMVLVAGLGVAGGKPVLGLLLGVFAGSFVAVLLAGLLTLLSWILAKSSNRQPSSGQPPGVGGKASAHLAGPPSRTGRDSHHAAEAARNRLPRPPFPSVRPPHRWRLLVHWYAIGYPGHSIPVGRG
jgi:Domain of unknown function (DUF1707)